MLLYYFCLISFNFLIICYAENLKYNNGISNASMNNNTRIKKHVDLKIYSNKTEYKAAEKGQKEIPNVCNFFATCKCVDNQVTCTSKWLVDLNIRASNENFVAKKILISRCDITNLEKGKIFPQTQESIEHITFYRTKFRGIKPGAFDNLTSLRILEFRSIALTKLNQSILTQQLGKTLLKFTYSNTKLFSFDPSVFENLINLGELSFVGTDFGGKIEHQFPDSLAKLKFLNLKACNLFYLGRDIFDNLRSLEYLKLDRNNFTSIPAAINKLLNLKFLNLGGNMIESYTKNSFEGNPNLESLFLVNSTYLKIIDDCAFCHLQNLKEIDFYSCKKLTKIHENAFGAISNGFTPEVTKFTIESCNISVLPEKLLNWRKIEKLSINHNPFLCNCSMAWLFKDLLSDNSVYERRLSSWKNDQFYIHHKYTLGCLDRLSFLPNHTHPHSIKELFASCPASNNHVLKMIFIMLFVIACFIVSVGIYANRARLTAYYSGFVHN